MKSAFHLAPITNANYDSCQIKGHRASETRKSNYDISMSFLTESQQPHLIIGNDCLIPRYEPTRFRLDMIKANEEKHQGQDPESPSKPRFSFTVPCHNLSPS